MKKLIFSSSLLISSLFYSQSNRIIVEIDNSQKYIYETTLNKLLADSYKREIADGIRTHADRYFSDLQKIADYFEPIEDKNKPLLKYEIERLKVYGYDIINLLRDLEKDQLTGTKLKYTVEKSFKELNSLAEKQTFKELNIYKALADVKREVLSDVTDNVFLIMVQEISGVNKDDLLKLHSSSFTHLTLREFLMEQYEKAFFIKYKYQK